jgi:hypothetical protein
MTHSSHRDRRIKAIAEVLAMIADAYPYPELAPNRPSSDREADEWLWEIATGFCGALDRYAEHRMQIKREQIRRDKPSSPRTTVCKARNTRHVALGAA